MGKWTKNSLFGSKQKVALVFDILNIFTNVEGACAFHPFSIMFEKEI